MAKVFLIGREACSQVHYSHVLSEQQDDTGYLQSLSFLHVYPL